MGGFFQWPILAARWPDREDEVKAVFDRVNEVAAGCATNNDEQWRSAIAGSARKRAKGKAVATMGTLHKLANEVAPMLQAAPAAQVAQAGTVLPRKVMPSEPASVAPFPAPAPANKAWTNVGQPETRTFFDPDERVGSPLLPAGELHPSLERYVDYRAKTLGATRSAIAMSSLAAVIAAVDQSSRITMMRHTDWQVPPRIWMMLIGDPSTKKSPVLDRAFDPLEKIEARKMLDTKVKHDAWKQLATAAKAAKTPIPPEPAPAPRLIVRDATTEKLAEILSRSNRGANLVRDELAGFICQMDRYANNAGGDRPFYLEAFNGKPFTRDRVKDGTTHIENCSLNVVGGIQPARLKDLAGLEGDGFLQRFLPVLLDEATEGEDLPDLGALDEYATAINLIYELGASPYWFDDWRWRWSSRFERVSPSGRGSMSMATASSSGSAS